MCCIARTDNNDLKGNWSGTQGLTPFVVQPASLLNEPF